MPVNDILICFALFLGVPLLPVVLFIAAVRLYRWGQQDGHEIRELAIEAGLEPDSVKVHLEGIPGIQTLLGGTRARPYFGIVNVAGRYRAHPVEMRVIGAGESWDLSTEVKLTISNKANVFLDIQERNEVANGLRRLNGKPGPPTGDHEFDERFVFKCRPDNIVSRPLLSADIRQKLTQSTDALKVAMNRSKLTFQADRAMRVLCPLHACTDLRSPG